MERNFLSNKELCAPITAMTQRVRHSAERTDVTSAVVSRHVASLSYSRSTRSRALRGDYIFRTRFLRPTQFYF